MKLSEGQRECEQRSFGKNGQAERSGASESIERERSLEEQEEANAEGEGERKRGGAE